MKLMERNYIILTTEELAQMSKEEKMQNCLKIAEHYNYLEWMISDIKNYQITEEMMDEMLTSSIPFTPTMFQGMVTFPN